MSIVHSHAPFKATSSHAHIYIPLEEGWGWREISFQNMRSEVQGEKVKEEKRPFYMPSLSRPLELT